MSTEIDGQFKEAVTGATKRKRSGGLSKDDQQFILNMLDEYLDHKGVDRKTAYYMICETSMCKAGYKDLYHQIKGLYPNVTDLTKRIRVIVSSRIWKTGKWTKEDLLQLGFLVDLMGRKWKMIGSILERNPTNCAVTAYQMVDNCLTTPMSYEEVEAMVTVILKYYDKSMNTSIGFPYFNLPFNLVMQCIPYRSMTELIRIYHLVFRLLIPPWNSYQDKDLLEKLLYIYDDIKDHYNDQIPFTKNFKWNEYKFVKFSLACKYRFKQLYAQTTFPSTMVHIQDKLKYMLEQIKKDTYYVEPIDPFHDGKNYKQYYSTEKEMLSNQSSLYKRINEVYHIKGVAPAHANDMYYKYGTHPYYAPSIHDSKESIIAEMFGCDKESIRNYCMQVQEKAVKYAKRFIDQDGDGDVELEHNYMGHFVNHSEQGILNKETREYVDIPEATDKYDSIPIPLPENPNDLKQNKTVKDLSETMAYHALESGETMNMEAFDQIIDKYVKNTKRYMEMNHMPTPAEPMRVQAPLSKEKERFYHTCLNDRYLYYDQQKNEEGAKIERTQMDSVSNESSNVVYNSKSNEMWSKKSTNQKKKSNTKLRKEVNNYLKKCSDEDEDMNFSDDEVEEKHSEIDNTKEVVQNDQRVIENVISPEHDVEKEEDEDMNFSDDEVEERHSEIDNTKKVVQNDQKVTENVISPEHDVEKEDDEEDLPIDSLIADKEDQPINEMLVPPAEEKKKEKKKKDKSERHHHHHHHHHHHKHKHSHDELTQKKKSKTEKKTKNHK